MIAIGSLSVAANKLRSLLQQEIADLDVDQIRIGHPKDTFDDMKKDKNYLNLFFYNVQYDGYPADGLSVDPFYVRLYCLITAVGAKKGNPSPGENDLRLIGEVMRVLHEQPVVAVDSAGNGEIAQLEIVPYSLSLDELNHIWSTQGDTAYRLSVAYEMALAPIPLTVALHRSSLVGETGSMARATLAPGALPETGFAVTSFAPIVPRVSVDLGQADWAASICFLDVSTGILNYTLLIPMSSSIAAGLVLKVLLAGRPSEQVDLVWEIWDPDVGSWQRSSASQTETIGIDTIDPNHIDPASALDIELPIKSRGQASLYAERQWQRPDGKTLTLRSNPLLVTVIEAAP